MNKLAIFVEKEDILNLFYQEYNTGKQNRHYSLQSRKAFFRNHFFRPIIPYISPVNRNLKYLIKITDIFNEKSSQNFYIIYSYHITLVQRPGSKVRRIQQLQRLVNKFEPNSKLQKYGPLRYQ